MLRIGLHSRIHPFEELDIADKDLPVLFRKTPSMSGEVTRDYNGNAMQTTNYHTTMTIAMDWPTIDNNLFADINNVYYECSKSNNYVSVIENDLWILVPSVVYERGFYQSQVQSLAIYTTSVPTAGVTSYNGIYRIFTTTHVSVANKYASHTFYFSLTHVNMYPFTGTENYFDINIVDNLTISYIGYGYGQTVYGCQLYAWNNKVTRWDLLGINTARASNVSTRGLIVKTLRRQDNLTDYVVGSANNAKMYIQARAGYGAVSPYNSAVNSDYIRVVANNYLCKFKEDLPVDALEFSNGYPIFGPRLSLQLIEAADVIGD